MTNYTPTERTTIIARALAWLATGLKNQGLSNITLATPEQFTVAENFAADRIAEEYGSEARTVMEAALSKFKERQPEFKGDKGEKIDEWREMPGGGIAHLYYDPDLLDGDRGSP